MLSTHRLGVIGAGNMGSAIIVGALKTGIVQNNQIVASDVNAAARDALEAAFGVATTADNTALLSDSDIILLAVKPQVFDSVMSQCQAAFRADHLVISIMAGIGTRRIEESVGLDVAVVRVMPNTPALVGEGISPYCLGQFAEQRHGELAAALLSAVGETLCVDESAMDAITATSGSGPAYVYYLMEAMEEGAQQLGLSPELARELVRRTVIGTAGLLSESDESPAELRRRVTSPGGTTAAAIGTLEDGQYAQLVTKALQAAHRRAGELGDG